MYGKSLISNAKFMDSDRARNRVLSKQKYQSFNQSAIGCSSYVFWPFLSFFLSRALDIVLSSLSLSVCLFVSLSLPLSLTHTDTLIKVRVFLNFKTKLINLTSLF